MTPRHDTHPSTSRAIHAGALALGVLLFSGALYYINFNTAVGTIKRLGLALPLAIFFSAVWHLARTWAWSWCFPRPRTVSFARLARVRLAAEAFSYLTLRGIAGEPLKVVLLGDRVDARQATAAVALERLAYMVGTTIIVGIGSILAIAGLPLTTAWFHVFRAFAITAAVLAALTAVVISGRGTYLQAGLERFDRIAGTSLRAGRVSRFVAAVERQMLELLRGNPVRLAVLLTATCVAYACMALEAWVILRATGAPITPNGALAVETFSRVASFASAFIPANLGALEASSLAAVAAVGAIGGGAALALARRLRGLFWAGLGLAIYPRHSRSAGHASIEDTAPPAVGDGQSSTLLYFPGAADVLVPPSAILAGLPLCERVLRPALRAGYSPIVVWAPDCGCGGKDGKRLRRLAAQSGGHITVARDEPAWRAAARDVAAGPAWPESGVLRFAAADALSPNRVLSELAVRRARALPLPSGKDVSDGRGHLALRIGTPADLAEAEQTIRRSSYKNTDAKVARFNRRLSLPISIALIRTPLTANQLSVILVALGFYSAWLFGTGHYMAGVVGGFLSLAASVLDGCDGEIARLKYQESALGCWIETFGDYAYYVAVFVGLTAGAVRRTGWEGFYWLGGVALAGTLISFALLIFLRTRITAGRPDKLHAIARERFKAEPTAWSKIIWKISFVATRAAMPYGIFALSLLHLLPLVVVLAALGANLYWVSLVLKLRHLLGAEETVAA